MDSNQNARQNAGRFFKGDLILHYQIIDKIGSGSMGEIYLALDTKLDRKVAIKILSRVLDADSARLSILEEARASSRLTHPNILTIYGVETYRDMGLILMEYFNGQNLSDYIKNKRPTIKHTCEIAIQLFEGLKAAHEAGVIHRDIKPQNILINENNMIKICDFGVSICGEKLKDRPSNQTAGTISYLSPEQAQGLELTQQSDLFSAGVLIYQLATGKLPFEGNYEAAIIYSILNESPRPPSSLNAEIPPQLERIMMKLLEKEPAERFATAGDTILAFRNFTTEKDSPGHIPSRKKSTLLLILAPLLLVILVIGGNYFYGGGEKKSRNNLRIAILPFGNLGQARDDYFVDGMVAEITTRLAKISALGVISHTSSGSYKNTDKSVRQISRELSVDYLLEGSLLWEKSPDNSNVRINVQLIKGSDETLVWAETYERRIDKVLTMQSEIAASVARALNIALMTKEKIYLEKQMPVRPEAYDYYLRGKQYYAHSWGARDLRIAEQMYNRAIHADTQFALAYAELSRVYSNMYLDYIDRTAECLEKARNCAENAIRFQPDLPEGHLALGNYYYSAADFENASMQYQSGLVESPRNSELLKALAGTERRRGLIEESIRLYLLAFELDPLSHLNAFDIGSSYCLIRNYDKAEFYLDRAIALAPDWPLANIFKAWIQVLRSGDIEKAGEILEEASHISNLAKTEYYEYYLWLKLILEKSPRAIIENYEADFDRPSYYLWMARSYRAIDNDAVAAVYYDSALVLLGVRIKENPMDPRYRSQYGLACAGLGKKNEAIREGRLALDILPHTRDAFYGQFLIADMAQIYTIIGEDSLALTQLRLLLSIPGFCSKSYLKNDPTWKSLYNNPEFIFITSE